MQTIAAAALDPVQTTRWALDALPAIDRLTDEVAALCMPDQIAASGAPQIEQWAEGHAVAPRRSFRA